MRIRFPKAPDLRHGGAVRNRPAGRSCCFDAGRRCGRAIPPGPVGAPLRTAIRWAPAPPSASGRRMRPAFIWPASSTVGPPPPRNLTEESTNGVLDGIWSLNVSRRDRRASQYKYYIAGAYKNDPRARLVTQAGTGGNSIVYDPTNFNWNGDNLTPPGLGTTCSSTSFTSAPFTPTAPPPTNFCPPLTGWIT